jgi:hypothetical protein
MPDTNHHLDGPSHTRPANATLISPAGEACCHRAGEPYRHLDAHCLTTTIDRLVQRIGCRFPKAGLVGVAKSVARVTREASHRAEWIRKPNWLLRLGLLALALLVLAGGGAIVWELRETSTPLERVLEVLKSLGGATVYVGAVVFFFVTLETRLKRARALEALHELRALAHIIDMHQLTKDPERVGQPLDDRSTDGPMSPEAVNQYLHYCTEMLAIVSKIPQLYIQNFPDATTLAAVDQFESLATGLSQKIWQKIMILDRVQGACALPPVSAEANGQDAHAPAQDAVVSVTPG